MAFNVTFESSMEGNDYEKAMSWAIERALVKAGVTIESAAVTNIDTMGAVDTGRLKGSIAYATLTRRGRAGGKDSVNKPTAKNVVHIGTNVEYAEHVEYGTRRMMARPFLRQALKHNRRKILETFQKWVEEGLRRGK